jgi:hypothetical protein
MRWNPYLKGETVEMEKERLHFCAIEKQRFQHCYTQDFMNGDSDSQIDCDQQQRT